MVGVSGLGPEQEDRRGMCRVPARNGYNARTLACGVAQACHCSAPSALHSGRAAGLGRLRDQTWGRAEAAVSFKRPSNVCQHPTENPGRARPLLPHP